MNVVAVRAPGFGDRRKSILDDLAILLSGQVISSDAGLTLEKIYPSVTIKSQTEASVVLNWKRITLNVSRILGFRNDQKIVFNKRQ